MPPGTLAVARQMPGRPRTVGDLPKILIFGPTGSGKSRFGLSFCFDPRTSPVLWCDPTGGTSGVVTAAEEAGATVQAIGPLGEVKKLTEWLRAEQGAGYKTVFFDDFSESFNLAKAEIAQETVGRNSTEAMTWEQYPKLYERTTNTIRGFLKLADPVEAGGAGLHVVVACWAEKEADRDGNELWVPQFAGKYGLERVGGYFDLVGFLKHEVKVARVEGAQKRAFSTTLLTLSGKHQVKDRWDSIPNGEMEMPTATALLDAIARKRKETQSNA